MVGIETQLGSVTNPDQSYYSYNIDNQKQNGLAYHSYDINSLCQMAWLSILIAYIWLTWLG